MVARPIGQFKDNGEYHYQTLRLNCDLLKIIQLGLSFTDEQGNPCPEVTLATLRLSYLPGFPHILLQTESAQLWRVRFGRAV